MKYKFTSQILFITSLISVAFIYIQSTKVENVIDYIPYHEKIIEAEKLIFIEEDIVLGLQSFEEAFQMYDFVFVDDCIEAFQLALFYQQDSLALFFIQRALDNGFRLEFLDELRCACPHNYYQDIDQKVSIHQAFIKQHQQELATYQNQTFEKYTRKIKKGHLAKLIERHIKEQTFKNHRPALGHTKEKQKQLYNQVCDSNLQWIKNLYKDEFYIGEQNIGFLSNQLLNHFDIEYTNDNKFLSPAILQKYKLKKDTPIPVHMENNAFNINMLYNILFHNPQSYKTLEPYAQRAIKLGYLHPREYASLEHRRSPSPKEKDMVLEKFWQNIEDTQQINQMRSKCLLPPYEVDYKKHQLAHQYCLKLSFGFFNGTR